MRVPILCSLHLFCFATAKPTFDIRSRSTGIAGLEGFALDNPIGPTTGGDGAMPITVSTPEELLSAVRGDHVKIIYLDGEFRPSERLRPGSHTTLLGKGKGANVIGQGVSIVNRTNIIIRNIGLRFVKKNDGMTIKNTTRVWVDHCEFESQFSLENGPDYFDGQLDIVHGSDWITVSNTYFHDRWKSSLIGNSDVFRDVDLGHLHITYHHNRWRNVGTRGPAGRFGHQHIYNNLYEDFHFQAIHSRSDNQVLVEGNKFIGDKPIALDTY